MHDTSLKLPTWNDTSSKLSGCTMKVGPAACETTDNELARVVQSPEAGACAVTSWHSHTTASMISVYKIRTSEKKYCYFLLTRSTTLALRSRSPALGGITFLEFARANSFTISGRRARIGQAAISSTTVSMPRAGTNRPRSHFQRSLFRIDSKMRLMRQEVPHPGGGAQVVTVVLMEYI